MRILGIDPGVAIVGFGLIESERGSVRMLQYGAVTTPAGLPLATRLVQIDPAAEAGRDCHRGAVFQQEHHHRHRRGAWPGRDSVYGGAAGRAHI